MALTYVEKVFILHFQDNWQSPACHPNAEAGSLGSLMSQENKGEVVALRDLGPV